MPKKLTQEEFVEKANKVHNFKYDYSYVEYKNITTKIKIICKDHGEFIQSPNDHLSKNGCTKCYLIKSSESKLLSKENFEQKAKLVHGDKYNYDKVLNKGKYFKITITCPEHGEFYQLQNDHLRGKGCPSCRESKGEKRIRQFLDSNNIRYSFQEWFKDSEIPCRNPETRWALRFDFYLHDYNLCIEYNGSQHYEEKSFGSKTNIFTLPDIRYRDGIKDQYCIDRKIKLVRIPYWDFDNIESILYKVIDNG